MGIKRFIRLGSLVIYECVKFILLIFILAKYPHQDGAVPWMAFAASGVLFPLMALFLWIDISRYKNYLPLYISGKCVGIAAFLSWSVINRNFLMPGSGFGIFSVAKLSGDLLTMAVAFSLAKKIKSVDTMEIEKNNGEDIQCG